MAGARAAVRVGVAVKARAVDKLEGEAKVGVAAADRAAGNVRAEVADPAREANACARPADTPCRTNRVIPAANKHAPNAAVR